MNKPKKVTGHNFQRFEIEIIPFYESNEEFQRRSDIVHSIVARMIAYGRKRGRPTTKEVDYEESA